MNLIAKITIYAMLFCHFQSFHLKIGPKLRKGKFLQNKFASQASDHNVQVIKQLKKPIKYIEEIKKSKFIVYASYAATYDDAMKFVAQIQDPQATHHCFAFRENEHLYRLSDDGEPHGTAGKPILSAIDSCKIQQVMVVVVRYFGGVKLGTGGLIRAYHGVVKNAFAAHDSLEFIVPYVPQVTVEFHLRPQEVSHLYYVLRACSSESTVSSSEGEEEVDVEEEVRYKCTIPEHQLTELHNHLCNLCQRNVTMS